MKRKILIISTLYYPFEIGGAERSTKLIAEVFKRQGNDVYVICSSKSNKKKIINGVIVYYIKFKHVFWRFKSKEKNVFQKILWRILEIYNPLNDKIIKSTLQQINPDLVFTNNIAGIGTRVWKIAKILKIPILHTARDYYLICARSGMYKNKKACNSQCFECKIYNLNKKKHSHLVDYFVGVSDFVKNIHIKTGYFKNLKNTGFVNNIFSSVSKIKHNYKVFKPVRFGFIGYIRETKGINQLLENLDFNLNLEFIIAGKFSEDKYGKEFKKLIKNNSKIRYLGYVNPNEFFEEIDYLIHPAVWHEPFPRSLIEAFSYGKPVIASKFGGTGEAITNQVNGFVYNNYNDLNSILKLLTSLNFNYSKASKACLDYSKKFSPSNIISEYSKIIK